MTVARCIPLFCVTFGVFSANAQYMTDTSSTYSDMWFDDTNAYITGYIAGSVSVHQYAVYLTIQSPSGASAYSYPGYAPGWVQNTLVLPWTAADIGSDFFGSAQHKYWCTISG